MVVRLSIKDWESIGDGNGGLLCFDYSLCDVNLLYPFIFWILVMGYYV